MSSISVQAEEKVVDVRPRSGSSLRSIADGFSDIYPQLRSMAHVLMRQERASHTLQPTAIVSEAFVRLAHRSPGEFATASNLLAVAAHAMRCVLVDHARARGAAKRGAAKRMGDAALAFVAARALLRTAVAVVAALLKNPQQPPQNRTITRPAPPALVARAAGIARSLAPRGPPSLSFA